MNGPIYCTSCGFEGDFERCPRCGQPRVLFQPPLESPKCRLCATPLATGAAACSRCGTLVASQAGSGRQVAFGVLLGAVLGAILVACYMGAFIFFVDQRCNNLPIVIFSVVVLVACVAALVYGIRLTVRRRPLVGTVLICASIVLLLPTAPCSIAVIFGAAKSTENCHVR